MSTPVADDATRRAGAIPTIDLAAISAICRAFEGPRIKFNNLPAERAVFE